MRILVTGAAGFIGFHLSQRLLREGFEVFGMDNMNNYYDVSLKEARLTQLQLHANFTFEVLDLADGPGLDSFVANCQPEIVVNLAAQAGVRYSLENPLAYINSNVVGFVNLLEACVRRARVRHFVFASSSSVYGANVVVPFRESDSVDHPVSLYAATKKSNELFAHSYSHLYGLPVTGLRFFTVYGPWGRPDMACFKFTDAIIHDRPIEIYNNGQMQRDFTYIDDVVEGVMRVMMRPPQQSVAEESGGDFLSNALYKVYNLGNHQPIDLMKFVETIEHAIGRTTQKIYLPMQSGDVTSTYAGMDDLYHAVGFRPTTSIEEGLLNFVDWYRQYYCKTEDAAA
ncbi:MAG: NAD-dependent epimerase [Acidobacteriaceae bacterium]